MNSETKPAEVSRASDGSSVVCEGDTAIETFTMSSAWDDELERNASYGEVMFDVLIKHLQRLRGTQGKRRIAAISASIQPDADAAKSLSAAVTDGVRQYTDNFEARFDRGVAITVEISFHSDADNSEQSSSKCSEDDELLIAR